MQRVQAKYRVMYIDYPFLYREMTKALHFYRKIHPNKNLSMVSLDEIIPHAIEWLHEKSFITVFAFHPPENLNEIQHLDGFIKEYSKGEIKINTMSEEWYSLELGNHMISYAHLFDDFYLIADDPVYELPLLSVLPKEFTKKELGNFSYNYIANGKLLRQGNDETSFVGTDLAYVHWQNIWYIIGASMGLDTYEL